MRLAASSATGDLISHYLRDNPFMECQTSQEGAVLEQSSRELAGIHKADGTFDHRAIAF